MVSTILEKPAEKIARDFQQAGKKKKGCGENAFLPACQSGGRQTMEWERFRTSSRKRKAKQKKFVFLIEKNFWGQVIKKM